MSEAPAYPAIDPTMLALLSIFGGVAITALAGFFGAWIQSRREHERWVREKRYDAFLALLQEMDKSRLGMKVDLVRVRELSTEVSLLGKAQILNSVSKLFEGDVKMPEEAESDRQVFLLEARDMLRIR